MASSEASSGPSALPCLTRRELLLLLGLGATDRVSAQSHSETLAKHLRGGRCAVLWRHGQTSPGVGDPPGFQLGDCKSQRNLSAEGRAQAQAAGAWFKTRSLRPSAVRSSAWCRCRDTADLAFGTHSHWASLDSSFGGDADGAARRRTMLDALRGIPAEAFEVWITHQVNITAFTGESVAMGEAVLVDRQGQLLGRIGFA
ncbi:histidine phosphatase family protein [Variovorax sp. J22P168]|uniref:histidine phosphatase family protein n=1 Tax=Variovorax jilinensis TaxID=3053513 RepID=UPI0025772CA6|nr:histidine phosphatase family protein [Variovorax sp. J22P168]MDM0015406.1 histidine phosphatase family protein [Variovorax sp. J22P168]